MLNQHKAPSFTSRAAPKVTSSAHGEDGSDTHSAADTLSPQLKCGRSRSQQIADGVSPVTATCASRPYLGSTGPRMGVKPQAVLYPAPN